MNNSKNQLAPNNITPFSSTRNGSANPFAQVLQQLKTGIPKSDIKQREGRRNGDSQTVEYVEWHTVADLLDRVTPEWSHAIQAMIHLGNLVVVIVALTIKGITREGLGTGSAESETGIKQAEHDALKRAAVKFGIARDLSRNDESNEEVRPRRFPGRNFNPLAQTQNELISPNQFSLIHKLAGSAQLAPETVCQEMFQTALAEISRRAASHLISYLQQLSPRQYE
jgi:Rad52/22 family double-strand break repair protein